MREAPTPGDTLYGGQATTAAPVGQDSITATPGQDSIPAAAGQDSVTAPAETTVAEAGQDTVSGAEGADSISAADIKITLPEGMEVDNDRMASFQSLSAELKLNSEQAQKVADAGFELLKAQTDQITQIWTDTQAAWQAELDKDPELGGDKKTAVQATIGKVLDQFGSKEAREAFDMTGAGMNPAIVRFVHNMAKALSEGTSTPTPIPPALKKTAAQTLYGS